MVSVLKLLWTVCLYIFRFLEESAINLLQTRLEDSRHSDTMLDDDLPLDEREQDAKLAMLLSKILQ